MNPRLFSLNQQLKTYSIISFYSNNQERKFTNIDKSMNPKFFSLNQELKTYPTIPIHSIQTIKRESLQILINQRIQGCSLLINN